MVQPRIILATWLAAFQQASHGGAFASSHQYRLLFASINDNQAPVASLSYSQLPKPRRVRRRSSSNTGPPPPQPELLLLLAAAEATTETTGDFESRQASSYINETTKKDSVVAAETNIDHAVSSMPRGGGDVGSSVEPMEEEEESSLSSSSSSKDLPLPSLPVPELPTMMQYVKFALPCLGLWIAGPLLSLVDTSFVGLSGSSDMSARRLAGKNERKNPRRRGGRKRKAKRKAKSLDFHSFGLFLYDIYSLFRVFDFCVVQPLYKTQHPTHTFLFVSACFPVSFPLCCMHCQLWDRPQPLWMEQPIYLLF